MDKPHPIKIRLSFTECLNGSQIGTLRYLESLFKGRTTRFPRSYPEQGLLHHQQGAIAELAFAKLSDRYWSQHVNRFHEDDLRGIEVRYSNRNDTKVRPDDNNIWIVSLGGELPTYEYKGCIYSEDAKRPEWEKDFGGHGKPAYFVPNDRLIKKLPDTYTEEPLP